MARFHSDIITNLDYFQRNVNVQFDIPNAYQMIALELVSSGILIRDTYFADVNPDSTFWKTGVVAFCNFIQSIINLDCKLPYHLSPGLLKMFAKTTPSLDDLRFFAWKIDPVTARTIERDDYDIRETGWDSTKEVYHSICMKNNRKNRSIYAAIRSSRKTQQRLSIRVLDEMLSGSYGLTAEIVTRMLVYKCDAKYRDMFNDFIQSLSKTELRAMLLTFGHTIGSNSYRIYVNKMQRDITVRTCFRHVYLNEKLFADAATLQNLKIYFAEADDAPPSALIEMKTFITDLLPYELRYRRVFFILIALTLFNRILV